MAIAQEVASRTWRMFIGGEWVEASNGAQMEVMNPAHGDVLGKVPLASTEDIGRAAEAAKAAFPAWWHLGTQERAARLRKLGQLIREPWRIWPGWTPPTAATPSGPVEPTWPGPPGGATRWPPLYWRSRG